MKSKKRIFSLRALIFAVLVTATVSSVTLSRYMTTVTGTATASIARYNVELVADEQGTVSFAGTTSSDRTEIKEYTFAVSSNSDVASDYEITVTFDEGLPAAIVPAIGNAAYECSEDGRSFTFTSSDFKLAMGDNVKNEHILTLTRTYFTDDEAPEILDDISVTISVTAQQTMTTQ